MRSLKLLLQTKTYSYVIQHALSTSSETSQKFKILVMGGGAAGCSMASKFASSLGKDEIGIVEPSSTHYYQPMFTLVGGGIKQLKSTHRPMKSVLPSNAKWIKDKIISFDLDNNSVKTEGGSHIEYDYLIVAAGVELQFDKIKGLREALEDTKSGVSTNYSPNYVEKTMTNLKTFKKGNVLYTFPSTPIKCGGAPIKAALIGEEYLKQNNKRQEADIKYCTPQPVVFGSPFYAQKILEMLKDRSIEVNTETNLIEMDVKRKEAVFERKINNKIIKETIPYSIMHVVPPMGTAKYLKESNLVDAGGYVAVNKETLQHIKYKNVFSLGDCSNLPTSKTAAAVAAQCEVLYENLSAEMKNQQLSKQYNGYTSCPLVTGYSKCMLAEFDYTLKPLETFPVDQSKERSLMFFMKKQIMPFLYWNLMLKGYWNGPGMLRKIFHIGGLLKQQNRQ